jgi:SAM-dependent methyltransferase
MTTTDHPLIELLALVNMVWQDSGPSSLRLYSEQRMFKGNNSAWCEAELLPVLRPHVTEFGLAYTGLRGILWAGAPLLYAEKGESHVNASKSVWSGGDAYEPYVGRWSRVVAREFLRWLDLPAGARWLDIGCGTGALTQTILAQAGPQTVDALDPSDGYLDVARRQVRDARVSFHRGDAQRLPFDPATLDAVVSGLVLNFIPNVHAAVAEMRRVIRPGGTVAAYVWDYAGKMELMRYFWDAVVALRPEHRHMDEGVRFPLCHPEPLRALFQSAGLRNLEVRTIDIPTQFRDFEDYWTPFLGGQFPAPDYAMSLSEDDRNALRNRIRESLPFEQDKSIRLIARAWGVRGTA